jgi:hypothetical protein
MTLGAAVGLASVSPWSGEGITATTFGAGAAVWLVVVQWLSAGLGGYLTGRLRTKWVGVHTDEVFFRDTAHGFLSWAVATLLVAAFLTGTLSSLIGGATQAATSVLGGAAQGAAQGAVEEGTPAGDPMAYFTDMLYRSDRPPVGSPAEVRAESGRILVKSVADGEMPAADRTRLAQLVAAQTGLPPAEAEKRVDEVMAQAQAAEAKVREAADDARKAGAGLSLFMFLSLLIGAFIGSVAAAYGGRLRDDVRVLAR